MYSNGNLYIGDFDRNKKHGKGTFYWLNLEENNIIEYYIGDWWDGLPSGAGKHQRCNGKNDLIKVIYIKDSLEMV